MAALLLGHLAVATILLQLACCADAHAYLSYPPSRNAQAFTMPPDTQRFWCPHCGQGGGPPNTPSICGDPFQNVVQDASLASWIFTSKFYAYTDLEEGAVIPITITMDTNHGGRMQVALCPLPANQATQDCFNRNLLRRVSSEPQHNNKLYWYLQPSTGKGDTITQYFKLPDGVSCADGCMLQWGWWGYQTCIFPCANPSDDVPGECGVNLVRPLPDQCTDTSRMEVFFNCADIRILPKGGAGGSATPNNPQQPAPAPVPSPSAPQPSPTPSQAPSPAPITLADSQPQVPTPSPTDQRTSRPDGVQPSPSAQPSPQPTRISTSSPYNFGSKQARSVEACHKECSRLATRPGHQASCKKCVSSKDMDPEGCVSCMSLFREDHRRLIWCLACARRLKQAAQRCAPCIAAAKRASQVMACAATKTG